MLKINNTTYFIEQLLHNGLSLKQIALGARLSLSYLNDIYREKKHLEGIQFNLLLGFYCAEILVSHHGEFNSKVNDHFQENNLLLRDLSKQPWQMQKNKLPSQMILVHLSHKESYLTIREQQVLYYLLHGHTKLKCAQKLLISERTVEYHWQRVCHRLGIYNLTMLQKQWKPKSTKQD